MEWEQPHWSGKPQPRQSPRQKLKPNGFAKLARAAASNAPWVVALFTAVGLICAAAAIAFIDIDPERGPRVTLDAPTQKLQDQLDLRFPGIEQTFVAAVESDDPETARSQALALAATLETRKDLFRSAFVPGTGVYYEANDLLYRSLADVKARVDRLITMQPLYQAVAAAPDIVGFAALANGIQDALAEGRSPSGFEGLLNAAAVAIEGEVRGQPRPIRWASLAGLGGEARSQLWFVLAEPMPGVERQAAAFAAQASAAMQAQPHWLWPRRALGEMPSPLRDFIVPAGLSFFITVLLLAAGIGSFRQSAAILLSGFVTLSVAAAAAAAMGRALDGATWSFAAAVLAPVLVAGAALCPSYAQARGRHLSPVQSAMLAAQHRGGLLSGMVALFAAFWLSWVMRQLPSLSQFAVIALIGSALAWLTAVVLMPATLVLLDRRPLATEPHWLDDVLAEGNSVHRRHALDVVAMVFIAAAIFCAAFLPGVRFGERVVPSSPPPLLQTPDSRGAIHILARPDEAEAAIRMLLSIPETVGAIRTIAQFLPPDADNKIAELQRLAAVQPFSPAARGAVEEDMQRQAFADLDTALAEIAKAPAASADLRSAAARLRRAVQLFTGRAPPGAARVQALENAMFDSLAALSSRIETLAVLRKPSIDDLDPRLRSRFVSPDGLWRIEVMPKPGIGVLSFAAAVRRVVPTAAGEPLTALARNEIFHHETLLALGSALVAAAILIFATLRSLTGWLLSLVPVTAFVTLTAAAAVLLDFGLNAAMLAGASAAAAVLIASSMLVAESIVSEKARGRSAPGAALRAALLSPIVLAGAVAPLAVSTRPAIQELGVAMALLLAMAALLCLLLAPALARWLGALTRPAERQRR